jgi:L-iditol 2-dehydrogenase
VPDAVPDELAVYAEVLSVGYTSVARMLHSAQLFGDGSTYAGDVVVQGSGPLALAHVIAARVAGAHRIVVVGMPEYRTRFMKQFGVDKVINVQKRAKKDERIATVTDYLDGRGADVVFECTGDPDVVEEGLSYLKPFGYYLVAGIYSDIGRTTNINVQRLISGKYATVVGNGGQTEQSYAAALRMMEAYSKTIPMHKIVTHEFPLSKTEEAMRVALTEQSMKVAFAP